MGKRVILCTESFTIKEVELLINVLNDKWDLESYKKKASNGDYRIVIPQRKLAILQSLIGPILPSMMRYNPGSPLGPDSKLSWDPRGSGVTRTQFGLNKFVVDLKLKNLFFVSFNFA